MNGAGYIQVRDKLFRFESASCFYNRRTVDVYGSSKSIRMKLCGLPIPGSGTPESLVGQEFRDDRASADKTVTLRAGFHEESEAPPESDGDDEDDLDLFTLSRVEIDQRLWLHGDMIIRAACHAYHPESRRMTVEFEVILRDDQTERTYQAEGMVCGDLVIEEF